MFLPNAFAPGALGTQLPQFQAPQPFQPVQQLVGGGAVGGGNGGDGGGLGGLGALMGPAGAALSGDFKNMAGAFGGPGMMLVRKFW